MESPNAVETLIFLGQIVSDCPPRRAQKDSSTLKVCIGSVADFVSLSGAPLKDCAWAKVSEVKIKRTDAPENWESTETTLKNMGNDDKGMGFRGVLFHNLPL